jgi:hypothetical protein
LLSPEKWPFYKTDNEWRMQSILRCYPYFMYSHSSVRVGQVRIISHKNRKRYDEPS